MPSGRDYTLEPGARGSYTFTGNPTEAKLYLYQTDRSYRLASGDHKFWWMARESRIGLDIEGR